MNNKTNNLGRDKLPVPWSGERWKLIDKTVHDESKRIKVAEKVFPVQPDPGAVSVPDDIIEEERLTAEEGAELPYIEISREFNLTDSQCEQEAELGTAVMLSRLAATAVALAADEIIFKGIEADLPQGVEVQRQRSANTGLLGLADEEGRVLEFEVPQEIQLEGERVQVEGENPNGEVLRLDLSSEEENGQGKYGEAIFNALSFGIERLRSEGKPPPYLFLLSPNAFAETYQTMPGTFTFAAERIGPLAEGGFHQVPALPPDTGFLVSLPGDPIRIAVSQGTITEYRQPSPLAEGEQKFRVVSRHQHVVRDTKAFLKFDFVKDGSDTARAAGTRSARRADRSGDGSDTARVAGTRSARRAAAAGATSERASSLEDRLNNVEGTLNEFIAYIDNKLEGTRNEIIAYIETVTENDDAQLVPQAEASWESEESTVTENSGAQPAPQAEASPESEESTSRENGEEPNATDRARNLANELGVDLSDVEGSGQNGRITVQDVRNYANKVTS